MRFTLPALTRLTPFTTLTLAAAAHAQAMAGQRVFKAAARAVHGRLAPLGALFGFGAVRMRWP